VRTFLARQPLGEATQGNDDLALHVQPAIIVQPESLVLDAIPGEHERRGDIELQLVGIHPDHHLGRMCPSVLASRPADRDGAALRAALGLLEIDLLKPAVAAAGLQAISLELRGDVARGYFVAASTGLAAFQQVVGQEGYVRAHAFGREPGRGLLRDGKRMD
jgi:hypothetical protein